MGVNLYTLRKMSVMILTSNRKRETVNLLQLSVEHALSQDSQRLVDVALRYASMEWEGCNQMPKLVVLVGSDGVPRPGSPIFQWNAGKRAYCFDHELPAAFGYLGERDLKGYLFRTAGEQAHLDDLATARHIDDGTAKVYKDFWRGKLFESGEEFLRSRERHMRTQGREGRSRRDSQSSPPPRLNKILSLIQLIERKGSGASPADLHFLGCLRDKMSQLGHPS
jgi:hypothetical protein